MSGQTLALMLISKAAESVMSGMAANAAGKANQIVAQQNAAVMRRQAENARAKAAFDANIQRKQSRQALARGKVGFLKGGVALTGSPVEVLGEAAADFEFQATTTQYGGELHARTFEDQARMTEYGGRVAAWRGKSQQRQSYVSAGVSLLGAAGASGYIKNPFASSPVLPSRAVSPNSYYPSLAKGISQYPPSMTTFATGYATPLQYIP